MYEMGGLAQPCRARSGQLPGLLAPRAARRCQASVRGTGFPAPPTFPGRPEVEPVSNGESIPTASANTAQEPEVNYFWFLCYPHGIHRKDAVIRT